MIDNYKDRHEKILFESLPFSASWANDILEYEYKKNWLSALKEKMAEVERAYKAKKDETTLRRMSFENTIASLDTAIVFMQKTIENTKNQILEKQKSIELLEFASVQTRKKIAQYRKIILSYLANIYNEWNILFDNEGQFDMVKTMIMTEETTDFHITDMTYKSIVSQLWQKFVEQYRALVRQHYVNTMRAMNEKKKLWELQKDLERQNAGFLAQKQVREKLLEVTKWQEQKYIEYIASQQKAQQAVADAWKQANEDYKKSFETFLSKYNCNTESQSLECKRLEQFFTNEAELSKNSSPQNTPNILIWPVQSRRITSYFRDPWYFKVIGSHHDAIDIGTPQSSDVYSAADGYVYYLVEPTARSYSYLAIKHRDGLVTVYGHLSELKVKPYQFVRQWEIIAKSGGMPWTPGAGPATSWPHLHFEVWKNKEVSDPLRFLTLTDIDYKTLPALYQTKFLADMVEKNGDKANLKEYKLRFSLRWNNEEERQKYLLATYATKDFNNWELWTDTALAAKIDPSFIMCIGLSETTLGNHLKTRYNIGNVGNTDDGSTVTFDSPKEGIAWMAKTFNNKYLGKYTKVSELSRWGNQKWPIYASSSSNWHDNTIRCLSALKWRFVEDDYNFRITR